jgi:hypothetical protein
MQALEHLHVEIPKELKARIVRSAKAEGLKLNSYVAQVFATLYKQPHLAVWERGTPGRHAKDLAEAE